MRLHQEEVYLHATYIITTYHYCFGSCCSAPGTTSSEYQTDCAVAIAASQCFGLWRRLGCWRSSVEIPGSQSYQCFAGTQDYRSTQQHPCDARAC